MLKAPKAGFFNFLSEKTFVSLKSRNYRLFFFGILVSNTGLWMQRLAMGWMVYRMTGSASQLAIVEFASLAPVFFLSAPSGAVLGHFDLRKLLMATQFLSALQALALAVVAFSGINNFWLIFSLSLFLGIVNGIDNPARLSAVPLMAGKKEYLSNAIALNSMAFNASRLIGPTIAGYIVAGEGEWVCFLLNAISFMAVFIALWMMKLPESRVNFTRRSVFAELKSGVIYAKNFLPVKAGILCIMLASFFCGPYISMFPVFAKDVLMGDAAVLGSLLAAAGFGGLVACIMIATKPPPLKKQPRALFMLLLIFGVSLFLFSLSTVRIVCLLISPFAGFGLIASYIMVNTILQENSSPEKRGHVMGIYSAIATGVYPFGTVAAGFLSDKIGVSLTLRIFAVITLIGVWEIWHNLKAIEGAIKGE